ncbi:MAG TPA: glycosyltransferase family 4 protein [Gemmatimonadales bacterium]|nr:glycosyltransferase family 4 protein [Gemmatimonadales bacterium]
MPTHLLLSYDFPPMGGGISRYMGQLARHYPADSLVVSTGEMDEATPQPPDAHYVVDRVPVPSGRLRTVPGLLRWSRRASLLARQYHPEFIWCGNLKPAGYPARWIWERQGIPYGVIVYGGDLLNLQHQIHRSALKARAAKALLGSTSVIVAISSYTRDLAESVLHELELAADPARLRIVPLGTDPEFFHPGIDPSEVMRRYQLPEGRWVLTVARLMAHKGVDTGIRAIAELAELPDVRYLVVGSGKRRAQFEALAQELGVADRVRFLSGVPDADLPALYNVADVYLGASRRTEGSVEGFGISLSEASACGVPVIGGRSGGIPDAVREGETGLLVDSENAEDVAAAIRKVLTTPGLAEALGRAGRAAVESYFNWERVTADLRAIAAEFTRPSSAPPAVRR